MLIISFYLPHNSNRWLTQSTKGCHMLAKMKIKPICGCTERFHTCLKQTTISIYRWITWILNFPLDTAVWVFSFDSLQRNYSTSLIRTCFHCSPNIPNSQFEVTVHLAADSLSCLLCNLPDHITTFPACNNGGFLYCISLYEI